MFFRIFSAAFLVVVFAVSPLVSGAQERQDVILVLDGSGSMWGQIDGVTKIEIARDAVATMVQDWDENTNLGLIAYGHREKGNCKDIETILPVGAVQPGVFSKAVNAINPRGKTPLSDAVRQAADTMKYTENKATVILVSDGIETCNADPCALATELELNGVDFTAHVIGFGLGEGDQQQLSCLAENTGGQFIAASNASELDLAIEQAVEVVTTVVTAKEKQPTGINATLVACDTCDPLDERLMIRVYPIDADVSKTGNSVAATVKNQQFLELPAGDYRVVGQWGKADAIAQAMVVADETSEVRLNLNAGVMALTSAMSEEDALIDGRISYLVYNPRKDLNGDRKRLDAKYKPKSLFPMPAGEYYVTATFGDAFGEANLAVAPGEVTEHQFNFGAGQLKLVAIPTAGAAPLTKDLRIRIMDPKRSLTGERKVITTSYKISEVFKLPAGTYDVELRHGSAFVEKQIDIASGQELVETIDMNVGYVRPRALPAADAAAIEKDVAFEILSLEKNLQGERERIEVQYKADTTFRLPAGKYLLNARHGPASALQEIEVFAGSLLETDVVTNSAILQVTAKAAPGLTLQKLDWALKNADQSETYGYDSGETVQFISTSGQVTLRLRTGDNEYFYTVDVIAGQLNELVVNIE